MPSLEARIETEQPSRYLVQFCKHAAAMGSRVHGMAGHREVQVSAEWSDTSGIVTFIPWGRCALTTDANILTLRIDSPDEEGARQIQDVVTQDLARFSRRNPLTVTWDQPPAAGTPRIGGTTGWIRSNHQMIALAVAGVLLVALHLGLAGTVLAATPWAGPATDVALALIALKAALIIVGVRRRALKARRLHRPGGGE
jgi:hypothetical protein